MIFRLGFLGFLLKHDVVVVVFCLVAKKLIFWWFLVALG